MKIQCEHCGAMIDTDKDKKCTNCGAPYKDNKEYKKLKDLKFRNDEADVQRKEYQNEMMKKAPKTIGKLMLVPFLLFLVSVAVIIFIFVMFAKSTGTLFNQTKNSENINTVETEIEVSFNELASSNNYDIICDEVRISDSFMPNSGNKSIGLHIIAKNKTDSMLQLYNFKLTYTDENGNTGIIAKTGMPDPKDAFNTLNLYVEKGYSASGYIYYEIPEYVNDVQLHFGKVLINLNNIDQIKK